ncbi:MAG: RNase H family protein [Pirellulales bacterium]
MATRTLPRLDRAASRSDVRPRAAAFMRATDPHFLLFSEALGDSDSACRWRFVLQSVGSDACLAVADAEANARASRLELLAVVRGLEALDQPSRVTLLTASRYVIRGIRRGLSQWRERRWRWERFGQLVPIRDYDLWQRVDRAMQFHQVECCEWRNDEFPVASTTWMPDAEARAAESSSPVSVLCDGPALVIVPRTVERRAKWRRATFWPVSGAVDWFVRAVFAQIAAFPRPAFTRAA